MFKERNLYELLQEQAPAEDDTIPPLMRVVWHDSIQPTSDWTFLRDLEQRKALICTSVGFFCGMSGDAIQLASGMTEHDQWGSRQVIGVITIPLSAINKIELYE